MNHPKYEDDVHMSALCNVIHEANVKAGWWTDLATGVSTIETRNRAEMLMLTVSELSEGSEGYLGDLNDDKLPQYKMLDVELADAAIRLFDQIGAEGKHPSNLGRQTIRGSYIRGRMETYQARSETLNGALMLVVNKISAAMENWRKGRRTQYLQRLCDALLMCFRLADQRGIDLFPIIEDKRAFNAQRADHKPENRKKDDGKKF